VENALIHTPPGTTVRVAAGSDGDSRLLEVADDGPGVPAEIRERAFERFARAAAAGAAPTSAGAGSGLGLAIVRAVAEAHGGSVELDAAPAGGARFRVRLPAASPIQTPTERVAAKDQALSRP
jgi:two-component system, OmpR family, sensor kinase